ncbi:MAG: Protein p49 [Pseudonocardia sp.]|nr:Protein p49 [Pseudonocardia sp.]
MATGAVRMAGKRYIWHGQAMPETVDAVVIGGGHHGLVAAATLADAGWDVVLLEAQPDVGGAVRSAELFPGYVSDLFSAFYPMSAVSPVIGALGLEDHGLSWTHAPTVLAHPSGPDDEHAAVLYRDPARTAAHLAEADPRDGQTWLRLVEQWQQLKPHLLDTLFTPFPPVTGPAGLLRALGGRATLDLARFLLLPVRRMATELFHAEPGRLLLSGNAMHADIPPDAAGSGMFGWLMSMLAQDVGFPVPVGGAGMLAQAMAARARASGVAVRVGDAVTRIGVRHGRVHDVTTVGGTTLRVRRAVIADVAATSLYGDLLPPDTLPTRLLRAMERFDWDPPVVKLNWALDGPIPWHAGGAHGAGTVHLGADADGIVIWMADLSAGRLPTTPFALLGQMTTADPTRSPAGTESAWAYTHLPRGTTADEPAELLAQRMEDMVEAHAPGFRERVSGRHLQRPSDLFAADANLVNGALGGGTNQIHQQLFLRPVPGTGRPETVIRGLYLGSAAAHPGGSVHGACGANAARAALADHGWAGPVRRLSTSALLTAIYGRGRSAR